MKKKLLTIGAFLSFTVLGFGISRVMYPPVESLHNYYQLTSVLDDEQYVVFRSKNSNNWNVLYPTGNIKENLSHRQVGRFFYDGETDTINIFPSLTEYQLEMEDDYVIVTDNGRHVGTIQYKDAGRLGEVLISDNE